MTLYTFVNEEVIIIYQKQIEGSTITVVVPNYSEIKSGTLTSIIRQSQLPRFLFEVK